jgi:hypothetical protein
MLHPGRETVIPEMAIFLAREEEAVQAWLLPMKNDIMAVFPEV